MRMLVVINPSARDFAAQRLWPMMQSRLCRAATLQVIETVPDNDRTRAHVRQQVRAGVDRVVAIGGDGTVHLVVNAIMQAQLSTLPELAVIPFGTANDIGKSLGLPLSDHDLLARIAQGDRMGDLDVGRIEARLSGAARSCHFVDAVTIGMDADVLLTRKNYRGLGGYLAYAAALAERTVVQSSLDVRVVVDGMVIDERVFNIIINNVPVYAGEFTLPGSSGGDGLLDVYLFNRREYASKVVSFAIKQTDVLRLGVSESLEEITQNQRSYHGRQVDVRLASPRVLQVDGEVFGRADEVSCAAVARLRVAVP